ncbi:(d)CMP kinase [Caldalkalibacillus mannanilyticus]|uniref:(d)CMP kinase n=1 Tax=Caldalkalibacillus mannanilyticus TaxID=1418 RepID=UPI000469C910|nr:(d)CMP kinase [Caldalkalibacillus mannanilyticus]
MDKINIAIDGPAGAGKSTVAKKVADYLRYIYIDTGAMYRALTWKAIQEKLDLNSDEQLSKRLHQMKIDLQPSPQGQKVFVDGEEVTDQIRQRDVTNQVSTVATHYKVREGMLLLQRELAENKGIVMDGRDIATHVLPDAEVKIFLSASIEMRAKRRFLEFQAKGVEHDLEQLKKEISLRDQQDSEREIAPLRKAPDAIEIDSSNLSIDEVVEKILQMVNESKKRSN